MAERVIVLVHGRLAAAGGHRAIRDAMDDRPRHVLVRADDGRRLAASLVGLESVAGVTFDPTRDGLVIQTAAGPRAGDGAAPARPRRVDPPASRCAPSTTRWRACSGSSSDDRRRRRRHRPTPRPGRGSSRSSATRCSRACRRKRWAAVLLPCAGALLFGLLAHAVDDTPTERAFANVAAEGIFALVMPIAALVIGDAVLGAEVRAGTFHFTWLSPAPTWQIVLGRWLGGSIVALVTIAPACALAAVVAGAPSSAGPASSPPPSAACPTSPCSSPSAASPGAPRCGRWRSCSSSSACSAPRSTGIAQLSPTWESRAIFVGLLDDPPTPARPRGHPAGRRRDRAPGRSCTLVALGSPTGGCAHAPLRRLRLNHSQAQLLSGQLAAGHFGRRHPRDRCRPSLPIRTLRC